MTAPAARQTLATALVLALGAAVSLGLARFAYALLLPPMRADLGWSYFTAGAMGTANAAGYLAGALAAPALTARTGTRAAFLGGALATAVLLALHAATRDTALLYALRTASGAASALVFVGGGLLAARLSLAHADGQGPNAGLVLGLYYGGTGLGIVASAAIVPPLVTAPLTPSSSGHVIAGALAGWPAAWLALAALSALAAAVMAGRLRALPQAAASAGPKGAFAARPFAFGLAAYFMFGLGYIGYMTFIVTLLREQALGSGAVAAFYTVLGIGVMASPFLWAQLLQRHRDGRPLATLSALLAVATALPVLWPGTVSAFASGALFGAVFLSLVASTTALVRHHLPPAQWAAGVSAFTIVFAIGQIIGPSVVGLLADGPGGLRLGLGLSALALAAGAALALGQRGPA